MYSWLVCGALLLLLHEILLTSSEWYTFLDLYITLWGIKEPPPTSKFQFLRLVNKLAFLEIVSCCCKLRAY